MAAGVKTQAATVLLRALALASAAAMVFAYLKCFLWIGPFGWPLGAPGAHGGFMGSPRILLVPLIALVVVLLLWASAQLFGCRLPGKRFILLGTLATTLAYFFFFDQSFLFGLVLRPLSLAWVVNFEAATPLWMLRLVGVIGFWCALELALFVSHRRSAS